MFERAEFDGVAEYCHSGRGGVPRRRQENISMLERIRRVREKMELQLEEKGTDRPSVAEYVRLLQLERELEQDAPKDIKVQWVDTLENSSSDK